MADRWRAPGGWTVEIVGLVGTPDHHDGEWYRICQHGLWTESSGIAFEGARPCAPLACCPIEPETSSVPRGGQDD